MQLKVPSQTKKHFIINKQFMYNISKYTVAITLNNVDY